MSQPPWEARSETTDSLVSKRNRITPRRKSCRIVRHQNYSMTGTSVSLLILSRMEQTKDREEE